jgi:hypothetical protein
LTRVSGAQHQVTNHGVTRMTNPVRLDDYADNGGSGCTVVGEIASAFIHHGQIIGQSRDRDREKSHPRENVGPTADPQGVPMAIKVAIDQGANQKALRRPQDQGLIELHQANDLEQSFRKVVQDKKGFMLGHSKLGGPDVLADEKVHEVERIVGLENSADTAHIYAAYLNECEYFVTENPDDFIRDGRREALDLLLDVKIRLTTEFLQEMKQADTG